MEEAAAAAGPRCTLSAAAGGMGRFATWRPVMSRSSPRALPPGALPRPLPAAPAAVQRALLPPWPRRAGRRWPASPLGMKVFRRKALVLCAGYALLLVLTMLNLLDYKWHKEPLQQCNPDGPLGAAVGAAGAGWGRPGSPPAAPPRAHSRMDPRTPYRPPAAGVGAVPAAAAGSAGAAASLGNATRGTRGGGDKRQLVYVFTTWRSGSSFFGELFNQNPEVFFLYEPVWHVWQKLYPGDAVSLQGAARDMLSALYRCDLSVFQLYSPAGSGGRNLIRESLQVVRSRDPRAHRMPFLEAAGHKLGAKKEGMGGPADYHALGAMEVICNSMAKTLQTALQPPDWLQGHYLVVRYEDLVGDPVKTLRRVYDFVGLLVSPEMEQFALNMTSGSGSSSKPFVVSARNATQAANAWRTALTFQQIKQVEEFCYQPMAVLGYERVNSPEEVKDLSKTLLRKPRL